MFHAQRVLDSPIIDPSTPGYDTAALDTNINGPSLIRVPDFVPKPLGRYYLYFAHHQGTHIRLAFADAVAGPWRVREQPTLRLDQTPLSHHIASPDVHVDRDTQQLRMYYHGCRPPEHRGHWAQPSCVAISNDGLSWTSDREHLGESYFRVYPLGEWTYAVAQRGMLYRSRDGRTDFQARRAKALDLSGRHWAVLVDGPTIHWFYSRWGDRPERILCAPMPLADDWLDWRLTERYELLRPERSWEGADEPLAVSRDGSVHRPVNELRDPCVFRDDEGTLYLVYSIAGESGLGLARLDER